MGEGQGKGVRTEKRESTEGRGEGMGGKGWEEKREVREGKR